MDINMKQWIATLAQSHKPLPLLSFPAVQLLGVSVYELTHNAETQAEGIVRVAEQTDSAAAVCMMDLSVEAEAFGCEIKTSETEIPTVIGTLIADEDDADSIEVPRVGAGRTGLYIEAARRAKERINDRPVLAGIIGPFSLAGRLMDVTEALVNCIAEPQFVHKVLRMTTDFLIEYARAYKQVVDGIIMAEPLAGLLSAELEAEFSAPYVSELIEAVRSDDFAVIYHNCGQNTPFMTQSLASNGADAYHFGDAVSMTDILERMPQDKPVCGNISPTEYFLYGTPEKMAAATTQLLDSTSQYKNFVLSSGCDIPPKADWSTIRAFYHSAQDWYSRLEIKEN